MHWVRPELVVEVKYLTWTDDNLLRQVVYEGLREDKPAAEVRRSVPHQTPITKVRGVVRPTFSPKPRRLIFLSGENTVRTVSDVLCETPIKRCDLTLVGGSKCLQYGTPFLRLGQIDHQVEWLSQGISEGWPF